MNTFKKLFLMISLATPGLVLAEGGGDIVFEKMTQASEAAMAKRALKNEHLSQNAVDYEYGMNLDIKRVIKSSPPSKSCRPMPAEMTYEDSKGKAHTIQYVKHGQCNRIGG